MKKKRLLAIFAAFAVAATMATGFTACFEDDADGNDDGTHTEQPGGDNTDPDNPNNPSGGDTDPENPDNPGAEYTRITEEEWIKAFEDTVAASSYTITANETSSLVSDGGETGTFESIEELRYDKVNNTAYNKREAEGKISEYYSELGEQEIIEYYRDFADGEWTEWDSRSYSAEDLKGPISTIVEGVYNVAETAIYGTVTELYSYAEFNSKTNLYTLSLLNDGVPSTLIIQFKNGYLYRTVGITVKDGNSQINELTITNVNSTVVTIPQEIKDAVADNGGDTNPDEVSYVGTYKVYSLIFGTTEYFVGDMAPAIGSGEEILLTEDYMVIVLNEDGTAIVSQTVGEFTQDIPCTWEALDVFIIINMNGAVQGFSAEGNTIFTTIFADVTNAFDPLVWTITLVKQ